MDEIDKDRSEYPKNHKQMIDYLSSTASASSLLVREQAGKPAYKIRGWLSIELKSSGVASWVYA